MAHAMHVKKARKNYPEYGIKKGEEYWWWKFAFGSKHYSKTPPTRYDLTQSDFQRQVYTIEDMIASLDNSTSDTIEDNIQNILSEIENLKSECEEKLSNMPEHLQESSSSGQLLQERIDNLDNWYSEIENIDLSSLQEIEVSEEDLEEGQTKEEKFKELTEEALQEIINKIQSTGNCF